MMPYRLGPPPMNPLSRLLTGVVAVLAIVGAFFFGLFVLAFVVVAGLIAWIALWLRMWWLRRKLSGSRVDEGAMRDGQSGRNRRGGEVIDAEYTVISRDEHEND